MSIPDTAAYLGLTDRTIREMIATNRLRAYKIGGKTIRLRRDEVDAMLTPIGAAAAND
jgi:excisionase family DNA binding protein